MSAMAVSRAYLNASTECLLWLASCCLLPEDPQHRDRCGLRKKHMYGTRAAADGWQQEYAGFMRALGFRQGEASPYMPVNVGKKFAVSVPGDNFTSTGPKCNLDWFEDKLGAK